MRTSNPFAARGHRRGSRSRVAGLIAVGLFVAACGSTPPSVVPSSTPSPTPSPTPNPHLTDPASADAVFTAIAKARLPISANNAAAGSDPVKQINATYFDWPMLISEYRSAASLAKRETWLAADQPARGDAPVSIRGINVLIEWGPTTGAKPEGLSPAQVEAMNAFLAVLDRYIGPLTVRSTTFLQVPEPSASPSVKPSASAKPSGKPSAKPSAKPTKKPAAP
jgi:hypothetical protein